MDDSPLPTLIAVQYPLPLDAPQQASQIAALPTRRNPLARVDNGIEVIDLGEGFITRLLSIVWIEGLVITAVAENPPFLSALIEAFRHGELSVVNGPQLIMDIVWQVSRQFILATRSINQRRDALGALLTRSTRTESLVSLSQLQKSLVYFESAVAENHPVYQQLPSLSSLAREEAFSDWLLDVLIENRQAEKMVDQSARMLDQLNASYGSIVSNRLNVTMKRLTSITIILTIPTIIGGLWGMNVDLPIARHPQAFWLLMLGTTLLSVLIISLLRRRDLL